jgi:hypothetical protein
MERDDQLVAVTTNARPEIEKEKISNLETKRRASTTTTRPEQQQNLLDAFGFFSSFRLAREEGKKKD